MDLDWAQVRRRYEDEPTLRSLTGSAPVTVVSVDDERICLSQRLWQDCVPRTAIERALGLLEQGLVPAEPIAFAEGLRRREAHVETGCTRGPNLTAIVLQDLGYLSRRAG